MSTASERTIHALEQVVKDTPVGTNLALLHLLWAMLSGAFLRSRGAVFPALQLAGFTVAQIRRCGQALRCGAWSIADLVRAWRSYVLSQGQWQPNSYEGYSPMAVDLTAFWRPRLKGRVGKFFQRIANRALKGTGFGLVVQVGQVGGQRIPLLRHILRAQKAEMSESQLKRQVLAVVARDLDEHEVLVHDAEASIADMQEAGVPRYVVRMALQLHCPAQSVATPQAERSPTGIWEACPSTPSKVQGPHFISYPTGCQNGILIPRAHHSGPRMAEPGAQRPEGGGSEGDLHHLGVL